MNDKILRWPAVHERTGISRTTAWREMKAGRFPAPVKITGTHVGWRESAIAEWIATRTASAEAA